MLEPHAQPAAHPHADAWQAPARVATQPVRRTPERRKPSAADHAAMRAALLPAQQETLDTLERFHWHLHFVRRPLFQPPIPVLFDRDTTRFVVIREDGTLDEQPALKLRG